MITHAAQGWFSRAWTKLFGSQDPEEREVRELQRQGSTMARLAHGVSTSMVILVSVATLITLGNSTLNQFLRGWQAGHPDWVLGTALLILFALVISMDTAMLYGAMVIRLLSSRMASWKAQLIHWFVVSSVALIEALTYYSMVQQYEHPHGALFITLAYARSFWAPGLSIYLMLARSLPVTATDILNIVSLRSGITMLKEVSHLSSREDTPLAQKFAVFHASSILNPTDQGRMRNMIIAVAQWAEPALSAPMVESFPPYAAALQAEAIRNPVVHSANPVTDMGVIADTANTATVQNVSTVVTATDREQYMALIDAQLAADPSASPSLVAATLGLPVPLVCQYMAKRMSRNRSRVQHA